MRVSLVPKRPANHLTLEESLHALLLALKDVVACESFFVDPSNSNGNGNGNSNGNGDENNKNGTGNGAGHLKRATDYPRFGQFNKTKQKSISDNRHYTNRHHISESDFGKLSVAIQKVIELHADLSRRNLDIDQTLIDASPLLGLDLRQLMHDCLKFPTVMPYTRNLKGQRRLFLCYCGERETVDREGLGLCLECLEDALESVHDKKKNNNFILYTSYSPQVRCRHADFSTLLITFNKPGYWLPAWCENCLRLEKKRLSA